MRETLENVSRDELTSVAALLDTKAAGFAALLGSPGPGPDARRGPTCAGCCGASSPPGARPTPSSTASGRERLGGGRRRPAPRPRRRHRPLRRLRRGAWPTFPTPASTCRRSCCTSPPPTAGGCGPGGCGTPGPGTGALPLVTVEDFDFDAPNRGEGYLRVGEAMAFVNETGKAVGFTDLGTGRVRRRRLPRLRLFRLHVHGAPAADDPGVQPHRARAPRPGAAPARRLSTGGLKAMPVGGHKQYPAPIEHEMAIVAVHDLRPRLGAPRDVEPDVRAARHLGLRHRGLREDRRPARRGVARVVLRLRQVRPGLPGRPGRRVRPPQDPPQGPDGHGPPSTTPTCGCARPA